MLLTKSSPRKDCIPFAAILVTPEYLALNPSQRKFVVRYINQGSGGVYEAVDALQFAYGKPDRPIKNVLIRAYQILRNKKVKKVLDIHFRRSGLEPILSDLKRAARKSVKLKLGLTPETAHALIAFEKYVAGLEEIAAKTGK